MRVAFATLGYCRFRPCTKTSVNLGSAEVTVSKSLFTTITIQAGATALVVAWKAAVSVPNGSPLRAFVHS